jgi:hypothetical protein
MMSDGVAMLSGYPSVRLKIAGPISAPMTLME